MEKKLDSYERASFDNTVRNLYGLEPRWTDEEIEKYQSMDQFQVGIAVFDPDTTETQFYDNVRSVCEMMNNNISISVGVTWAEHGKEFNEKIMEADWRMYEQKNAYHQQQQAAQQELLQ